MQRILVLNFFPAHIPPTSGGELRYFNLYRNLSSHFDVTLLSPTFPYQSIQIIEHSATFRECRVPKESVHESLNQQIEKDRISPEFSALVCALSSRYLNSYHHAYLHLYPGADILIHECPFMLEYDLMFGLDNKLRIYNSYNYETHLMRQMWQGKRAPRYIEYVEYLESRLVTGCDLCFCISEEERNAFVRDFAVDPGKLVLVPNGINPADYPYNSKSEAGKDGVSALFVGSFHPPNLTAVQFIIDELADHCPNVTFVIAGECTRTIHSSDKKNVKVLGKVSDELKYELLAKTDIAINPMFAGGGTNIKVLEFLAAGMPLISTRTGTRGLDLIPNVHFVAAGRNDFSRQLNALAQDIELQRRISQRGRQFVEENYSWESIAFSARKAIDSVGNNTKANERKKILLLNDFEVNAPRSKPETRTNRIYSYLSRKYQIALLCFNDLGMVNRSQITDDFIELSIPRITSQELVDKCEARPQSRGKISETTFSKQEFCLSLVQHLYDICDGVILLNSCMVTTLENLTGKPVVYDRHIEEYELISGSCPDPECCAEPSKEMNQAKAIDISKFIIANSDQIGERLLSLGATGKPVYLVHHGLDIGDKTTSRENYLAIRRLFGNHPVIVFIGENSSDAVVTFINKQLASLMPDCYFLVAVDADITRPTADTPPNLLLLSKVNALTKDILLSIADIAIYPGFAELGCDVKLSEYMSKELPVITTPSGVGNLAINNQEHAIVCELTDFKEKLYALIQDDKLRQSLASRGYQYARFKLDWKMLAKELDEALEREIFGLSKKRILVVTYRFTDPPLGGAEVHLLELLRQLDKTNAWNIDVATLDIRDIYNHYHFSSRYTHDMTAPIPRDLVNTKIFRFKTDVLPDEIKLRNSKILFNLWMEEFRVSSLRHLNLYSYPLLLGGWNHPEYSDDKCEIWTSKEALVFVPEKELVSVIGCAHRKTKLTFFSGEDAALTETVKGKFNCEIRTKSNPVLRITARSLDENENDAEPLGVKIQRIAMHKGTDVRDLALDYDYKSYLKRYHLETHIDELIRTAESRPREFDELFQLTRGPISQQLDDWLEENTGAYDVILGHSVPFATSVAAVKYGKKYNKPVLLVPEYHFDDEYYHWSSYYDALRKADALITFPQSATELFYEKIKSKSTYLPIGIHMNELISGEDRQTFRQLYPYDLPYVLILSRKNKTKNYDWIIEAVRRINTDERLVNIVFIGQDEDGICIPPEDAVYLGRQPRGVVLTALQQSLCLVTMSESESFGIVVLEAWAQSRPVVVNENCVAYKELVEDQVNGLHANKDNLAERIKLLLNGSTFPERLGGNGYDTVKSHFAWESISKKFIQILNSLIDCNNQLAS